MSLGEVITWGPLGPGGDPAMSLQGCGCGGPSVGAAPVRSLRRGAGMTRLAERREHYRQLRGTRSTRLGEVIRWAPLGPGGDPQMSLQGLGVMSPGGQIEIDTAMGQLASIGRRTGVARILGMNFSGFFAKLPLIIAGLRVESWLIVGVALIVSLLTLYSMMKIWAYVFWEPASESLPDFDPLSKGKWFVPAPILRACNSRREEHRISLSVLKRPARVMEKARSQYFWFLKPRRQIFAARNHPRRKPVLIR